MSLKRKIAITGSLVFLLCLLLVCLLTGAYFYLPFYLESKIIPQLAADAGLSDFSVSVPGPFRLIILLKAFISEK